MKCHKPDTDQEATFTVSANDKPCAEYILPSSLTADPNVVECFIPVTHGDRLTVSGTFHGTILHGSFDVLADGSYLADKRHEGAKTGEVKFVTKRKLDFPKFFDNPKPQGHTSIYEPKDIVEGHLHVKALDPDDVPDTVSGGSKLGVGSLTIIVSVNQKTEDNYKIDYADIRCGGWREREHEQPADAGLLPTHELTFKITDDNVHKNRQSRHHRHLRQTRFGSKPWAKFIFHYRARASIEEAGCQKRSAESQALESEVGEFIKASTEYKAAGQKRKREAEQELNKSNGMFVTPEPPMQKQKLFGKSLHESDTPNSQADGFTLTNDEDELMNDIINDQQGSSSIPIRQENAELVPAAAEAAKDGNGTENGGYTALRPMTSVKTAEETQSSAGRAQINDSTIPMAQAGALAAPDVEPGKGAAAIQPAPLNVQQQARTEIKNERTSPTVKGYGQNGAKTALGEASHPVPAGTYAAVATAPAEGAVRDIKSEDSEQKAVVPKVSPGLGTEDSATMAGVACTNRLNTLIDPATPTSLPGNRPASALADSRESTPSRRARNNDHALRMEAIRAQKAKEREAKKEAMLKDLEEKTRLRVEEEQKLKEAELREFEVLKSGGVEDDDELAEIERKTREEEAALFEIKKEREDIQARLRASEGL